MDIIILATLAAFIFFKLRNELGKIDDNEKNKVQEQVAKKREEQLRMVKDQIENQLRSMQNQAQPAANEKLIGGHTTSDKSLLSNLDAQSQEVFEKILQSCNFTAEFFIGGAKQAFETIIKAFANAQTRDLETLKFLLSEKLYQQFESAINQRKAEEKTMISNIIAISGAKIVGATLSGNIATITINFSSQQINYIKDKSDNVVEGSAKEIIDLNDKWTFKKDLTSTNPNWSVVSTYLE